MNRDSLLPRSLFSASTLKREPVEETLGKLGEFVFLGCFFFFDSFNK